MDFKADIVKPKLDKQHTGKIVKRLHFTNLSLKFSAF